MGLIVPEVGAEPGPDWANDLNADLGILDQHTHAAGQGLRITPSGLNINVDLPINNNNLTQVKTVNFTSQLMSLPGVSPNLGCIYVAGNELYYNDEIGNVVPITNNGTVNAGAGSITGLPSGTASASYNSGSSKFVWQSATSTAADMDGGSYIFREKVANAKGITLSSPTSLAADYQMFWPSGLPGAQNIVTLDSSGNIGAVWNVDNSTIVVASNLLQVPAQGITRTQIYPVGQQVSSSCNNFSVSTGAGGGSGTVTNLSVTLTTSGRPVMLMMQPDGATDASVTCTNANTRIRIFEGGSNYIGGLNIAINGVDIPFYFSMLISAIAGTYTYTVNYQTFNANTVTVNNYVLVAYEL